MKTKIGILVLALFASFINVQAQRIYTTRATSYDISDNLDLDAVASIFGESKNLEDFEHRLNDPNARISNLDLNQDGYIDYLRVVENSTDRNSLVVIQAVLDDNVYQDVATIEIERTNNGNPRIQIVGDSYLYGPDYIIAPIFVRTPLIFSFFWGPHYTPWNSPCYWNHYPRWYSYYRPYSPFRYRRHVAGYIDFHNSYERTSNRFIHFSDDHYDRIRRNDYATRYPDRAFTNRNQGISNRHELDERRSNNHGNYQRNNDIQRSPNLERRESQNSRSERYDRRGSTNELKSGQTPTREYNGREQRSNESRNQSYNNRSESRSESVARPERSATRMEAPQREAAPREKSANVSNQGRANREVRQNQRSERRAAESSRKEQRKEDESGRRR